MVGHASQTSVGNWMHPPHANDVSIRVSGTQKHDVMLRKDLVQGVCQVFSVGKKGLFSRSFVDR